jgi:hypothetical protein
VSMQTAGLKPVRSSRVPWTDFTDNILRARVAEVGARKRVLIASGVPGKGGKQCRDRWLNHLMPGIIRGPFSEAEKTLFDELVERCGRRWSVIAKFMSGRTDNDIKNYYYSSKRAQAAAGLSAARSVAAGVEEERVDSTASKAGVKRKAEKPLVVVSAVKERRVVATTVSGEREAKLESYWPFFGPVERVDCDFEALKFRFWPKY